MCTEQGLYDHNDEVDSNAEIDALVQQHGGAACSSYNDDFADNPDVPNWEEGGVCHVSGSQRPLNTVDCADLPGSDQAPTITKRRLCYCFESEGSGEGSPTDFPAPTASSGEVQQWVNVTLQTFQCPTGREIAVRCPPESLSTATATPYTPALRPNVDFLSQVRPAPPGKVLKLMRRGARSTRSRTVPDTRLSGQMPIATATRSQWGVTSIQMMATIDITGMVRAALRATVEIESAGEIATRVTSASSQQVCTTPLLFDVFALCGSAFLRDNRAPFPNSPYSCLRTPSLSSLSDSEPCIDCSLTASLLVADRWEVATTTVVFDASDDGSGEPAASSLPGASITVSLNVPAGSLPSRLRLGLDAPNCLVVTSAEIDGFRVVDADVMLNASCDVFACDELALAALTSSPSTAPTTYQPTSLCLRRHGIHFPQQPGQHSHFGALGGCRKPN